MNFAGTALVISHDRFFLDRVATHILAFEGDSKVGCERRCTPCSSMAAVHLLAHTSVHCDPTQNTAGDVV
jgi:ATPase subunit of ABC transporter with duplicated ATPase domains